MFTKLNRRFQSGLAAVETLFILPVLIILFAGVLEIGRILIHYTTLNKSLQNAVRFSVIDTYGTERLSTIAEVDDIKEAVIYGGNGSSKLILPGISVNDVSVDDLSDPKFVVVSAEYSYVPIFAAIPFTGTSMDIKLNASSVMRISP
ncbi:TadE/TadG family type IV pilus assembly protein [Vibrio breoganii]|uniref:TadE/TadG family type IV pilus assembly protein n=1 Tax=Vibrio breoganii TaxID=553239 RepID=UPI00030A1CD2|nr:TadE/TadG family type IV pilus assembly protein [Vibrio breoganii]OEF82766.1 hypothetical protein B003_01810 [Vibrio breoganii 1C10]PMG99269.1 hypothetical protein BCU79_03785 [Vibrio breoganii]PML12887.1 hypothetical protein BCT84_15095 [Vibrio breoganii]PML28624.1 hypothetical protein BCT82_06265 [Vibrio breoganii]PML35733.1 hypothetical protein BCT78_02325 [Vibrio breoganii]